MSRDKIEITARALARVFHGDETEWRGFLTKATQFHAEVEAIEKDETLLDLHRSVRR